MPLNETRNAIGEVTRVLAQQLTARTDATTVDVGRPEHSAQSGSPGPKLNLFLYGFNHDAHMRNVPLDRGQEPPIWLCLKFLMTAVDGERDSDSSAALDLLGQGMLALRQINMQRPPELALLDNPEPIKIGFDDSAVELLSAIMQGTDEHYRLSAAFDLRPLMLTRVEGSGGAPLIHSVGAPANPGILVLPSLGPRLDRVEPMAFDAGDAITLQGGDLAADTVEVCFGTTCFPVPAADVSNRELRLSVPAGLSAGSHSITARRTLPNGRRQSSNAVLGRLRPTVTAATPGVLSPSGPNLLGDVTVTGDLLGTEEDAVFVGFYSGGVVRLLLEVPGTAAQTSLTVSVPEDEALPPGSYRIIVRVNGEQAMDAPEVTWA
ncbi:Pvc16 family protein [Amaricoccus tamworthensis]|uniref:Pvc16 family protein n=1 Tax=Amaricoccus tamworthensis TaxID=57002 RepID=UPI003C7A6D7C